MKKIFSSKKRVAAIGVITAATMVGGGMAVAYWTNGGSGTGSATAGTTSDNLIITGSVPTSEAAGQGLVPGGTAQALLLNVNNPNTYSVQLTNQTVSIVPGSITCDLTEVGDSWFTLAATTIRSETVVGAERSADLDPSGVTLQMIDLPTVDQNDCKDAAVAFDLTVS